VPCLRNERQLLSTDGDRSYASSNASPTDPSVRTTSAPAPAAINPLPLQFLHFQTPRDGEDLKQEFKTRLSECESLLTPPEWHDVVEEASRIFSGMLGVVEQLDGVCCTDAADSSLGGMSRLSGDQQPLSARLQDSVAVAKERSTKKQSRQEDTSTDSTADGVVHPADKVQPELLAAYAGGDERVRRYFEQVREPSKKPSAKGPGPSTENLSRSVRFEKKLPVPDRADHDFVAERKEPAELGAVGGGKITMMGFLMNILPIVGLGLLVAGYLYLFSKRIRESAL